MPDEAPKPSPDVVLLAGPTDDGGGMRVLRARQDRLETGEIRPLQEGVPIRGEVVTLKPRENTPQICDVEVAYTPPPVEHKGPAQVATQAYRDHWDDVFGQEPRPAGEDTKLLN